MKKFLYSLIAVLILVLAYQTGRVYAAPKQTVPAFTYYAVIEETDGGTFQERVRDALSKGYTLIGGVTKDNNRYIQAVAK